jgi:hypothetical protein
MHAMNPRIDVGAPRGAAAGEPPPTSTGPNRSAAAAREAPGGLRPLAAAGASSTTRAPRASGISREAQAAREPDAQAIQTALMKTAQTPEASFLAVGYSPTGGGHTGRTLNIVHRALDDKLLKPGSTVIFHAPTPWDGRPRSPDLDKLAHRLTREGVIVVIAEADKSVQGYLQPHGASDDARILTRLAAEMPNRPPSGARSITDAHVFRQEGDFQSLPSISAKDLMGSIKQIVGEEAMGSKFRVLTDMDPALQKAAAENGVPAHARVDQQNHAVLLDRVEVDANFKPENAFLAKVLSGHGSRVSHIGLGDKNTLTSMHKLVLDLGLTESSSKAQARDAVSRHLLDFAEKIPLEPAQGAQPNFSGIMHREPISSASVKNIVYVYAHNHTPAIGRHIREQLKSGHEDYKDTLFVFCGKGAVTSGANALHLAYAADADGITTAGAGTNGEFAFLHKNGGAKGGLMVLPIARHNEQQANAEYLADARATREFTTRHVDTSGIGAHVDAFVTDRANKAAAKYAGGNLSQMLQAVGDKSDYVQQATRLLFGIGPAADPALTTSGVLGAIEGAMQTAPVLTANRKFAKAAFQAMARIEAEVAAPAAARPAAGFEVALTQKDPNLQFSSLQAFHERLTDDRALTEMLGCSEALHPGNVVLLEETRNLIADHLAGRLTDDAPVKALKEAFGARFTTGF